MLEVLRVNGKVEKVKYDPKKHFNQFVLQRDRNEFRFIFQDFLEMLLVFNQSVEYRGILESDAKGQQSYQNGDPRVYISALKLMKRMLKVLLIGSGEYYIFDTISKELCLDSSGKLELVGNGVLMYSFGSNACIVRGKEKIPCKTKGLVYTPGQIMFVPKALFYFVHEFLDTNVSCDEYAVGFETQGRRVVGVLQTGKFGIGAFVKVLFSEKDFDVLNLLTPIEFTVIPKCMAGAVATTHVICDSQISTPMDPNLGKMEVFHGVTWFKFAREAGLERLKVVQLVKDLFNSYCLHTNSEGIFWEHFDCLRLFVMFAREGEYKEFSDSCLREPDFNKKDYWETWLNNVFSVMRQTLSKDVMCVYDYKYNTYAECLYSEGCKDYIYYNEDYKTYVYRYQELDAGSGERVWKFIPIRSSTVFVPEKMLVLGNSCVLDVLKSRCSKGVRTDFIANYVGFNKGVVCTFGVDQGSNPTLVVGSKSGKSLKRTFGNGLGGMKALRLKG